MLTLRYVEFRSCGENSGIRRRTGYYETMITQSERAAEQRRAKLREVQRQLDEGSLTIRQMTKEERALYPPRKSDDAAPARRRPRARA